MNVAYLGAFTEPDFRIITDVLMLLSALGVAVLLALAWREHSKPKRRVRAVAVEMLPRVGPASLAQNGASSHPWEFPCAGSGATRAPPLRPPVQQSRLMQPLSGVAAPEARIDRPG